MSEYAAEVAELHARLKLSRLAAHDSKASVYEIREALDDYISKTIQSAQRQSYVIHEEEELEIRLES